ncbi:signal peptidase II [Candidatus Fermentibacteria bacterium]|nr:signal peptidase II [Candidatus Fermentibacteria bacterium]
MLTKRLPWLPGAITAGLALLLDQGTKALVNSRLPLYDSIPVIGHVVRITHTRNPGIAFGVSFGILSGWFLTAVTVCGVVAITIYLVRQSPLGWRRSVMMGLILGGAIGNLIDRLRWGEVVDFLDIGLARYRWPVFNVADSVVVVGVVLLLLIEHAEARESETGEKPADSSPRASVGP